MFMKFKKKLIEENELSVNELIDLDGDFIEGGEKTHWDTEIKTGPINQPTDSDSDYEKGLSTVTDKMAQYANPRNWWQMLFGYGATGSRGGSTGVMAEGVNEEEQMRNKIMELLSKYSDDRSFVGGDDKDGFTQNPSLDALGNPALIDTVNTVLLALKSEDPETVNKVMQYLQQSIQK